MKRYKYNDKNFKNAGKAVFLSRRKNLFGYKEF